MKDKPIYLIFSFLVYVLLMTFCQIPTPLAHTSMLPSLAFLSLISAVFGPWWGGCIGFLGHVLSDAWHGGQIWLSWALGSGLMGLIFGISLHRIRQGRSLVWSAYMQKFQIIQVVGNFVVFGLISPTLDVVFYHASSAPAFQQGWLAGLINSLTVGVFGYGLIRLWAKERKNNTEES